MKYEELKVWQMSIELSCHIYQIMRTNKDFGFKDQICRSAVSVPSNIAEGCERIHIKETINFLSIAKGSVGELKTQIIIGQKIEYLPNENAEYLKRECDYIGGMLGSLIKSLRATKLNSV